MGELKGIILSDFEALAVTISCLSSPARSSERERVRDLHVTTIIAKDVILAREALSELPQRELKKFQNGLWPMTALFLSPPPLVELGNTDEHR